MKQPMLLLYVSIVMGLVSQAGFAMEQTVPTRKVTQGDWSRVFKQARPSTFAPGVLVEFIQQAFSRNSPFLLATSAGIIHGQSSDAEVWVTQQAGKPAKCVAMEPDQAITTVVWSPNASRVAYVAEPARVQAHRDHETYARLVVARVADGHKIAVADHGALAPQWSSDGRTLLFFRWDQHWLPYRTTRLDDLPKIEAVSKSVFAQPGAFSPDGAQVAGLDRDGLFVTEVLASHHRKEFDLPMFAGHLEEIQWSADAKWIYVRMSHTHDSGYDENFALNVAAGTVVNLVEKLANVVTAQAGELDAITSAAWLGTGHALILKVLQGKAFTNSGDGSKTTITRRWTILNVDSGAIETVSGIDVLDEPWKQDHHKIVSSPDGKYVLIDEHRYNLDVQP